MNRHCRRTPVKWRKNKKQFLPIKFFLLNLFVHVSTAPWWLTWYRICLWSRRLGFDPRARKIHWRKEWQLSPVFLPGELHGPRSLMGYSPWAGKESNTQQLTLLLFTIPGGSVVKNSLPNKRRRFDPWVKKIPWRRVLQLSPVFLPGEFHGQRSLGGYFPWGSKESDMTK